MNYIGMHIVMLNLSLGKAYYDNLYWSGTIVIVLVHLFFSVTQWGQRSSKPRSKEATTT